VLAVIPLTVFRSLNMSLKNKIGLSLLFSFGLVAGVAAIYKTSRIPGIAAKGDFTWNSYDPTVWTAVEMCLVVVSGTIPTLKPLFDQARGKTTTRKGSYYAKPAGYGRDLSQSRSKLAMNDRSQNNDTSRSRSERRASDPYHDTFRDSEQGIRIDETFTVEVHGASKGQRW
jgi:hypothetical protein